MTPAEARETSPTYYSGLFIPGSDLHLKALFGTFALPDLDWEHTTNGVTISVADVTPLECTHRAEESADRMQGSLRAKVGTLEITQVASDVYAISDPNDLRCRRLAILEMPADQKFNFGRTAPLAGW